MTAHAESTHTYGLGKLSEMRPDVTDADNQRDATFRAQYRSFILPLMITLIGGIPVEVLHQCPHGGEHVFRHALPYAPLALVTMVPRGSTPGQMYASTPALKVCNHSRRVY